MPEGKSKGKNHYFSPIFILDEGEGMHDFTKVRNKIIFSYAYKTEFFHLPKTFFYQTLICLSIPVIISLLEIEFCGI